MQRSASGRSPRCAPWSTSFPRRTGRDRVAMRHVAVTGLGAVTALGGDTGALLAGLTDGRCGIGQLTRFSHGGRCRLAAEVPELMPPAVAGGTLPVATVRR